MNLILETVFGSHLYGTETPQSDRDVKGVFIPTPREVILRNYQPVIRRSSKTQTNNAFTEKNKPGDYDAEFFSLDKFVDLLLQNQTVALDVLFSIPEGIIEHGTWLELYQNRDRFRSKNAKSFIGYCRQQANKYGIKGSRVAAVNKVVDLLNNLVTDKRVGEIEDILIRELSGVEHIGYTTRSVPCGPGQTMELKHLEVCNRLVPFTQRVSEARKVFTALQQEYGRRSIEASNNENIDWKALSHAVRVGTQSIEYLTTGKVTFPRPDAAHLLEIKLGQLPYAKVADEIENLLVKVEETAAAADLPEQPDRGWADDFVYRWYHDAIVSGV